MNSKTDNYVHFVDEFNDNLIIDGTRILKGGAIEYFDIIDPKQSKLFPRKTSVDSFVYDRLFIRPNFPTRVYPNDQGFVFYLFHPRLVNFNSINKTFQVVPGRFRSHLKSKSHNNGLILSLENSLYFLDSTEKNAEVKLKKEFDQKITHLESNGLFDLLITEDNYDHKIFDFESVKSIKIEGSNIIDVFTEKSNVYILTDNMIQLIDSTFEKAEIIFHLGELAFEEFKSVKYYDDQLLLCSNIFK